MKGVANRIMPFIFILIFLWPSLIDLSPESLLFFQKPIRIINDSNNTQEESPIFGDSKAYSLLFEDSIELVLNQDFSDPGSGEDPTDWDWEDYKIKGKPDTKRSYHYVTSSSSPVSSKNELIWLIMAPPKDGTGKNPIKCVGEYIAISQTVNVPTGTVEQAILSFKYANTIDSDDRNDMQIFVDISATHFEVDRFDNGYPDMIEIQSDFEDMTWNLYNLELPRTLFEDAPTTLDMMIGIEYLGAEEGDSKKEESLFIDDVSLQVTIKDNIPPTISNVQVTEVTDTSATITWDTDEPSDSEVNYWRITEPKNIESDETMTQNHKIRLTGLIPDTTYYFTVKSTDTSGNPTIDDNDSTNYTFATDDTSSPIITNVQVINVNFNSAIITWDTNELSDSLVNYGVVIPLTSSIVDSTMVTVHTVSIMGLNSDTTYYFEVQSINNAGNSAIDDNNGNYYTFTTDPLPVTTPITTTPVTTTPVTTTPVTTTPVTTTSVTTTPVTTTPVTTTPVTTTPVTTTPVTTTPVTTTPVTTTPVTTTTTSSTTQDEINTKIQFLHEQTAKTMIEIDQTYIVEIKYTTNENTKNPIDSAKIKFKGDTGDLNTHWNQIAPGIYRIEIKPKKLGFFKITIEASKEDYKSAPIKLDLEVVPIQTDLYFISTYQANQLVPFHVNDRYTTIIQFNRTSTTPETPIDEVKFAVSIDPINNALSYQIIPLGFGRYQLKVNGSLEQSQQVCLTIEASKSWNGNNYGYERDFVTLVFFSGLMETKLRFLSNNQSTETSTVKVYDTLTTWVQYNVTGTSPEVSIINGELKVQSSDIFYSITPMGNGIFQIEIPTTNIGQFTLDLAASAGSNYQNSIAYLTIRVIPIPTNLQVNVPESNIYNQTILCSIRFMDDVGQGISLDDAHLLVETDELLFLSIMDGELMGEYILSFNAPYPGTFQVILTLQKPNYVSQSIQTTIIVDPIPMTNKPDILQVVTEQETRMLTIELRNSIDDTPIIGANVTYSWEDGFGVMRDLENGTYIVEIPRDKFDEGQSYLIEISAEKANHAPLEVEYLITPKSSSFLKQYWKYFGSVGILTVCSTSSYILIDRKKRRAQTILTARKQVTLEYLTDIAHFMDLLVITPSGIPFYSFTESISPKGLDPSLYSSFLLSIKTFAEESLQTIQITNEDHFRFGGTEIFLYRIRELIFAFFFSAQLEEYDEWKKVSPRILQRCREFTIQIEKEFQDVIHEFVSHHRARIMEPSELIEVVIKGLELDFIIPHYIINMNQYKETNIINERIILQTIEQMALEMGVVDIFQVLEQLKSSEIPVDDILYVFYQLRNEGTIVPFDINECLSIINDSLLGSTMSPIDLEESMDILTENLRDPTILPIELEEQLSVLEESMHDSKTLKFNHKTPEHVLSLLERLKSILKSSFEEK